MNVQNVDSTTLDEANSDPIHAASPSSMVFP